MRYLISGVLICFSTVSCSPLFSQSPQSEIEAYLSPKTVVVARVNLAKLDPQSATDLLKVAGFPDRQMGDVESLLGLREAFVGLGVKHVYWTAGLADLPVSTGVTVFPTEQPKPVQALLKSLIPEQAKVEVVVRDGSVLIADKSRLESLRDVQKGPSEDLVAALQRVNQGPHGIAIAIPPALPELFRALAASNQRNADPSVDLFVKGVGVLRWMALSTDLSSTANWEIETPSEDDAKRLHALLAEQLSKRKLSMMLPSLLGKKLRLAVSSEGEFVAKLRALRKLGSGGRLQKMNSMKQIALALHNYAAVYQHFPPQSLVDADGNRLFSWRVLILPYMEQQALFDQFRLDEPWDSEHNLKIAQAIPFPFADPGEQTTVDGVPATRIVAPMTKDSAFGRPGKPLQFRDVRDGTSNTIWFIEAPRGKAVPWTKPEDLAIDIQDPMSFIVEEDAEGFLGAQIDGSVLFRPASIGNKVLNALITIDGREVIEN